MNDEFSCQEMVEVVTDYLDDALPPDGRQRFERHLSYCAGCRTYVDQMRETIRQTATVPRDESLPAALRVRIVAQFRHWKRGPDSSGGSPAGRERVDDTERESEADQDDE